MTRGRLDENVDVFFVDYLLPVPSANLLIRFSGIGWRQKYTPTG
jgi:hypothetical protein